MPTSPGGSSVQPLQWTIPSAEDFKAALRKNLVVKRIPLFTDAKSIRAAYAKFGIIKALKLTTDGLYQKATITYESADALDAFTDCWSVPIGGHATSAALAMIDRASYDLQNVHVALLSEFSTKCFSTDIFAILQETNPKSVHIPRTDYNYN